MFIYICCPIENGSNLFAQGFHKESTAVDYVITSIEGYINGSYPHESYYRTKKKTAPRAVANPIAAHILFADPAAPQAAPPAPPVPPPAQAPMGFVQDQHIFNGQMQDLAMPDAAYEGYPTTTSKASATKDESIELTILTEHIKVAKREKTMQNALLAIQYYEDYSRHTSGNESSIHVLKEVKTLDE